MSPFLADEVSPELSEELSPSPSPELSPSPSPELSPSQGKTYSHFRQAWNRECWHGNKILIIILYALTPFIYMVTFSWFLVIIPELQNI